MVVEAATLASAPLMAAAMMGVVKLLQKPRDWMCHMCRGYVLLLHQAGLPHCPPATLIGTQGRFTRPHSEQQSFIFLLSGCTRLLNYSS
jgi:hypothetical protein